MRILLLAGAATSLVACSSIDSQPEQRSAQAQATFDRLLAGRSPGRAEHCLPLRQSHDMVVIDDETILFRFGRTTYANRPLGGCDQLGRNSYALVTRSSGSGLCSGDFATVLDTTTGVTVGSCVLGDFVPYRPTS